MTGKYRSKVRRSAKKRKPPGRKQIIERNVDNCIAVDDESSVEFAAATTTTEKIDDADICTCSKKFKIDKGFIREKQSIVDNDLYSWCYLLFDIRCILDMVDVVGRCPSCCEKISVYHNNIQFTIIWKRREDCVITWTFLAPNVIGRLHLVPAKKLNLCQVIRVEVAETHMM